MSMSSLLQLSVSSVTMKEAIQIFCSIRIICIEKKPLFVVKNHEYFGKPSTTANEKAAAAENAALFTKKMPFYFPEVPITRKMHMMS